MSSATSVDSVRVLLDARDLLKHGWSQGAFARDINGNECPVFSKTAVAFCFTGAITRAAGCIDNAKPILRMIDRCITTSLPAWNDTVTYDEMLACMDESIATAKAQEVFC